MSDHEQLIRERAYYIWEEEGRPNHRAETHWLLASQQVGRELALAVAGSANGKPKRVSKAKSSVRPRKATAAGSGRAIGILN